MIRHIVMFKFLESAMGKSKAENIEEAKALMLDMKGKIPEIVSLEVKLNENATDERNFDFILLSDFENYTDLNTYQKHPLHKAFGDFVRERRFEQGRAAIDYEY